MKKIALAVLLASGLMAADSGVYIGADIGNTAFDMKASALGVSAEEKDDGGSQTLKVGYYLDKNSRACISYQNINVDGGDAYHFGIGYDYLIGDNDIKPFVGGYVGYGSAEVDVYSELDISGVVFGAQAGVNYAINDNFSVEAGYRYIKSNMEDTINIIGVDVKLEVDPIKNWFVGVNYKF
ncbi:porin family protein [Candidatus Sulfurimonas marisnigri]|uniref:Porin family protein n=1 Tax=Candidatus Sulfurimonas marisnigri TaxID=2740405 RepID=A0A7S7LZG5_9BACT|nr:outer membrane beta-barrel protein [Candidatus Sulfurimonas marisnigri]QOY54310.1 porin family protein [Candidatus Sulfurimonas marisnigri]